MTPRPTPPRPTTPRPVAPRPPAPGLVYRLPVPRPPVLLVAGPSGSGKTRLCLRAAARSAEAGRTVGGVLSPRAEGGAREDAPILARALAPNLPGGETRVLAHPRPPNEGPEDATRPLATPRWRFEPETVAWADAHLARLGPTDLLVVDELGPLELERGEGFRSALPLLDRGAYRLALAAVRPSLLPAARARWPRAEILDVRERPDWTPDWTPDWNPDL